MDIQYFLQSTADKSEPKQKNNNYDDDDEKDDNANAMLDDYDPDNLIKVIQIAQCSTFIRQEFLMNK